MKLSPGKGADGVGQGTRCGGFPKIGIPFGGPNNKDYSILGSRLGSPYLGSPFFGKLPCRPRSCGCWVGCADE